MTHTGRAGGRKMKPWHAMTRKELDAAHAAHAAHAARVSRPGSRVVDRDHGPGTVLEPVGAEQVHLAAHAGIAYVRWDTGHDGAYSVRFLELEDTP